MRRDMDYEARTNPREVFISALQTLVVAQHLREEGKDIAKIEEEEGALGIAKLTFSPLGRAATDTVDAHFADWVYCGAFDGFVKHPDGKPPSEALLANADWLVAMSWSILRIELLARIEDF